MPERTSSLYFLFGLILFGMAIGIVLSGRRVIWHTTMAGVLMPTVIIVMMFVSGILYFRYFVQSPFAKGMGQSWSQFKLADWAHPFVMALVLLAVANMKSKLQLFNGVVGTVFLIGLVAALLIGVARTKPLMRYYSGINNLNRFYLDFRETVNSICPQSAPVYLSLGGQHHKFRQMAVLYLYDREVASDWTDDGYIYARLPIERRVQELAPGNCVVEPYGQDGWLVQGTSVGPFRVGVYDGNGRITVTSVNGGYDREGHGKNWWHWVERKISFKLQPVFVSKEATKTRLRFEYVTRGNQSLTLRIIKRDELSREFLIQSDSAALSLFSKDIDISPSELAEISVETDGIASSLGKGDPRVAAWMIRNLAIRPVVGGK